MTFNELMFGISFVTPLFCALGDGRKAGFLGALVAVVVGATLGICSFLMTKGISIWVRRHPKLGKRNPEGLWMLLVWILCAAMFTGICGFGVLGVITTRWVTSHVAG